MKKMKKLMAMLLALTMVLGMSVTSFATEPEPTPNPNPSITKDNVSGTANDTGTITVQGIQSEDNVKVYAIPVVRANYQNPDNKFSGYVSLYTSNIHIADNAISETGSNLANALSAISNSLGYTENGETVAAKWPNAETTEKYQVVEMTKSADAYTATVPVGSYLVLVKGAQATFYNPIIVSVSYVGKDGTSAIQSDTLNIENGVSWVKISTTPNITKESKTPAPTGAPDRDGKSANVGEVLDYTVAVAPIPAYEGSYPKFNVLDTLSEGLAFYAEGTDSLTGDALKAALESAVKVSVGNTELTKDTDYTVTINVAERTLKVDFVLTGRDDNGYTLNAYANQALKIEYKAKITDQAKMNNEGNDNTAKLYFTKDSYVASEDDPNPPTAKTYNYTFDLSGTAVGSKVSSIVNKHGETVKDGEPSSEALAGAEFTLYTNADCSTEHIYTNDLIPNGVVISKDGTNGTTKGALVIQGLAAGTYYLKETAAPAGYSLNADVYMIEITANYVEVGENKGKLDTWGVKVSNTNASKADDKIEIENIPVGTTTAAQEINIPNTKLTSLPSTGGIGTTIFTIGGCAIMILAAALYFATRRKSAK